MPVEVDYEIGVDTETQKEIFVTGYTGGDRTIETWKYWLATGDYPWPNAFETAVSVDVEELLHLNGKYCAWKEILKNAKPK